MSNRIIARIAANTKHLETVQISKEKFDKADKEMVLDIEEHAKFQGLKSEAFMAGMMTQDEAMTIYNYLGEVVTVFNRQSLGVRVTLMDLFRELLQWKIGKK